MTTRVCTHRCDLQPPPPQRTTIQSIIHSQPTINKSVQVSSDALKVIEEEPTQHCHSAPINDTLFMEDSVHGTSEDGLSDTVLFADESQTILFGSFYDTCLADTVILS